jgi:hypothetical protein
MLSMTVGNKKINIFFYYNDDRVTTCCIFDEDENDLINKGFAFCNPKDRFCKAVGRKVALTYAMWTSKETTIKDEKGNTKIVREMIPVFTKEERTKIWQEYFKKSPVNKLSTQK